MLLQHAFEGDADLATKAKVGISTVRRIDAMDGLPNVTDDLRWRIQAREERIAAVRFALERAGIKVLTDDGDGIGV
jgi:hypothetical protein